MRDHVWESALEAGVRNQQMITLAKNHCTRMEFVQNGGQGMAEEATGLPINAREVRCPMAHGHMISSNLEATVPAFYRQHCVGCQEQRPTGLLPTLGAYVKATDENAAAERKRDAEQRAALHEAWEKRTERRRGLMARCDDAMVNALTDIAILDVDPGGDRRQDDGAALGRLKALAERAPDVFTADVVAHAAALVEGRWASPALLDPLRIVALSRSEFGPEIVCAALVALRTEASGPGGRCLADLAKHAVASDIDDDVCRSTIALAGAPMRVSFSTKPRSERSGQPAGRRRSGSRATSVRLTGLATRARDADCFASPTRVRRPRRDPMCLPFS